MTEHLLQRAFLRLTREARADRTPTTRFQAPLDAERTELKQVIESIRIGG